MEKSSELQNHVINKSKEEYFFLSGETEQWGKCSPVLRISQKARQQQNFVSADFRVGRWSYVFWNYDVTAVTWKILSKDTCKTVVNNIFIPPFLPLWFTSESIVQKKLIFALVLDGMII